MTTREEISKWFDEGVKNNQNFMIVAYDQFDYSDYPVYVCKPFNPLFDIERLQKQEMTRVMECYNLNKPKEEQLNQNRTWEIEPTSNNN